MISDYKCKEIQILVELFIGFTNRNVASQKIMGWFVLQQAGHSYFGAVALPSAQGAAQY